MYVCICNPITDSQVRQAISEGCQSLCDLRETLGLAKVCGRCEEHVCDLLQNTEDRVREAKCA
ncbi:MAG: (2Fe-2S)-binding protein [Cyanobacteria bacterium SID2]|nr:(2Fe-2S)-binding protein [Cyanobacteria bacterium SID2]MBP0006183.1 (2Fe-2S)-binding protein [Cyanobacteria bacterium SBC]